MKNRFGYIMLVLAILLAGTAAYFSIIGLSQLFAGATLAVIIMASVLELGKIVITTALHTYWTNLNRTLKIYLTTAVAILMIITSAGIYGFLSNAYQKTANELDIHEGEVKVLVAKKEAFQATIDENKTLISDLVKEKYETNNRLNKRINDIDFTKGNQSKSADKATAEGNKRLNEINDEIDVLNVKNSTLLDSVNKYNVKVLELKSGSKIAGEVGPLKYISELTGTPMANVVNYLILLLIFVFDPLAIALVLATNKIFELNGQQTPLEPKTDYPEMEVVDTIPTPATPVTVEKEAPEFISEISPSFPDAKMSIIDEETDEDEEYPKPNDKLKEAVSYYEENVSDIWEGIDNYDNEAKKVWKTVKKLKEEGKLSEPTEEEIENEPTALAFTNYDIADEEIVEDNKEETHKQFVEEAREQLGIDVVEELTNILNDELQKAIATEQEDITPVQPIPEDVIEPVKEERIIRKEDIKEIKERGFSVNIPARKEKSSIQRIGSNKEIRGGDNDKIFFNKGK